VDSKICVERKGKFMEVDESTVLNVAERELCSILNIHRLRKSSALTCLKWDGSKYTAKQFQNAFKRILLILPRTKSLQCLDIHKCMICFTRIMLLMFFF